MKPAPIVVQNELVAVLSDQADEVDEVDEIDEVDEVDEYLLNLVPGNVI